MARLLIHVEGEAEETFVNEVLARHLYAKGYHSVSARLVGNARLRKRRGGICAWPSVRSDILSHLKQDTAAIATTMVDYYALPSEGDGTWPNRASAKLKPFAEKASFIEGAMFADVAERMGNGFDAKRFIPFVVMHEFEGLLFSDCGAFSSGIGRPDLRLPFQNIRNAFASPEEINDSPITAPSKRVVGLMPGYRKPLFGTLAVLEIGLDTIRAQCAHFNNWLSRLETLTA